MCSVITVTHLSPFYKSYREVSGTGKIKLEWILTASLSHISWLAATLMSFVFVGQGQVTLTDLYSLFLSFFLSLSVCFWDCLTSPSLPPQALDFHAFFCTNFLWYPLYLHFVSFYLVSSTETTPFSLSERMLMKSQILEQEFVLMLEIILFPVPSSYMSLWSHKKGKWVLFMPEQHNTL